MPLRSHLSVLIWLKSHTSGRTTSVALRRVWWITLRGGSGDAGGRAWRGHTSNASTA
ncbi:protein of unknown function [Methylorubrum extorquens]|uniref:Uncharacterized protein n=1 Tax=Methylorubrum extorquens TaxID=408 RepID=A0A2N9AN57_METEX|nr:protein of unknown function [Methylorubrum extorquens]